MLLLGAYENIVERIAKAVKGFPTGIALHLLKVITHTPQLAIALDYPLAESALL